MKNNVNALDDEFYIRYRRLGEMKVNPKELDRVRRKGGSICMARIS